MAYWLGIVFLAIAGWLVWSAQRHKAAAAAEEARQAARLAQGLAPDGRPPLHPSLSIMADIVPGMVLFMVAAICAALVIAFFAVGASSVLSLFDLAAALLAAAAYGYWVVIKAKFRSVEPVRGTA